MLSFEKSEDSCSIIFPVDYYEKNKIEENLLKLKHKFDFSIDKCGNDFVFNINKKSKGDNIDKIALEFFSAINGYPVFSDVDVEHFKNSENPLVSCIILLTANDLFVKNNLIPSIIKNSTNYPIEIIIVCNGPHLNREYFKNLFVLESDFLWVSRGYNNGVRNSKGKYIAIFHDDCIVNDSLWLDKCIKSLDEGFFAATPEFRPVNSCYFQVPEKEFAKCVPLFMKRKDYIEMGMFDEHYYMGLEDMDFSLKILNAGKRIKKVDMDYLHFDGMSTILVFSIPYEKENYFKLKKMFSYNIIPLKQVRKLNYKSLKNIFRKGLFILIKKDGTYLVNKFKDYFEKIGRSDVVEKNRRVERVLKRKKSVFSIHSSNKEEYENFLEKTFS